MVLLLLLLKCRYAVELLLQTRISERPRPRAFVSKKLPQFFPVRQKNLFTKSEKCVIIYGDIYK